MNRTRIFLLCCGGSMAALVSTSAADLQWGINGTGGTGSWASANWFDGSSLVAWSAGNTAVFGGTAGTVTSSGIIPGVEGMRFDADGYLLTGGVLNLSGTAPLIHVSPGLSATNNSAMVSPSGVTITGGGTLVSGAAITNAVTVDAGSTLVVNNAATLPYTTNVTVNGKLDIRTQSSNVSSAPVLNGTGLITNSGASVVNLRVVGNGGMQGNFGGTIAGPVAFIYQGSSTQWLSGPNLYTGTTLLRNSGTLRLAHAEALSPNTYLDFQAGTYNLLELAAGDLVRQTKTTAGGVSFTTGGGSAVSAYFAAIGADRNVSITSPGGELVWGISPFAPATIGFGSANSTHKVTWTGSFSLGTNISAIDRVIDVLDGPSAIDAEISGVISSGTTFPRLDKRGAGTLLLSGANSYTSETRLEAGTLMVGNDMALGTGPVRFHLSGATLRSSDATPRVLPNSVVFATDPILGTADSGDLTFSGSADTGSGGKTITVNNARTTINGDFLGSSGNANVKTGPGILILNGFAGAKPLLIQQGSVVLGENAGIASTNIVVNTNTIFDVGAVIGGFTIAGDRALGGSGTVKGNTTLSFGALVQPGVEVGTLTFLNDLTLSGAKVNLEVQGPIEQSAVNDLIQVNGNLNLTDLTTFTLVPLGGSLANGTYKLFSYGGTLTGDASNLQIDSFSGARQSATISTATAGQVNLVISGAPANLEWRGTDINNPTIWDLSTVNWVRGSTPDTYFNLDNVTFNDLASTRNVDLSSALSPGLVTVDTTNTYIFGGSGNLTGMASITKNGPGTLVLGNFGINNNSGPMTINAGTVIVGNANNGSGSLGAGEIINQGTLRFQNYGEVVVAGSVSGGGSLVHEGMGSVVLAGSNSFTGPVTAEPNSRFVLQSSLGSSSFSLGQASSITVKPDAELQLNLNGTFTNTLTISGDGREFDTFGALRGDGSVNWNGPITLMGDTTIGADSGTLTLNGAIAGGDYKLTKAGGGTLVLATNNTYGDTLITSGTLRIGSGSTNGTLGQSTSPIENHGILAINRADTYTLNNEITGTGEVQQVGAGTLVLTSSNSFSGRLMTAGGTLALGHDAATGTGLFRIGNGSLTTVRSSDSSTRTIANAIDFATSAVFGSADSGNLVFNGDVNTGSAGKSIIVSNSVTTFNGVLSGGTTTSANVKAGPGTLVLNGANTYGKPTVVNEGKLIVNGTIGTNTVTVNGGELSGTGTITGPTIINAGGTLAPGVTTGTLTINNTLLLAGNLVVDIGKAPASGDLVSGLTSVAYGGTLTINSLPAGLVAGDAFKLFDAAAYSGAFASIVPAAPGSGLSWDTSTLAVDGTLRVTGGAQQPTDITFALSGNTLQLSWPQEYQGWKLQGQTNAVGTGLSAQWFEVPGAAATNEVYIGIDPTAGSVFYRLVAPTP